MDEEKDYKFTGFNYNLIDKAKILRKYMTKEEKKLWYGFLKNYRVKFYRQRPIHFYIADFYSSKAKLVIEIDGLQHYTPDGIDYDEERTKIINTYNIEVIRFKNSSINYCFDDVCRQIDLKVMERMCNNQFEG